MLGYLLKRIGAALIVLIGTSLITFIIAFIIPADPALTIAGAKADPKTLAIIRSEMGLDQPLYIQYGRYLGRLLRGDLGRSYARRQPVATLILDRFPASALLAACAMAVALLLGIPMGVVGAVYRDRPPDSLLLGVSLALVSMPVFWLGTMMLVAAAAYTAWLPLGGFDGPRSLIMPSLALGLGGAGYYSRILQANLVQLMHEDFVRTARSKGIAPWGVLFKHALANAILPLVTLAGLDLAGLLSGVVLTETVFDWPGIGRLAVDALFSLDLPLIMGTVMFSATLVVVANIIVDLLYGWLDPRVRLS